MRYRPSLDEYLDLARRYTLVPVYRQLIGDTLTPVGAFRKIDEGDWAFLFESVVGGERLGRYSFLGADPFLRFQAWGRRVRIEEGSRGEDLEHPDPLRLLEEIISRQRAPQLPGLPRFSGGAVGYAGYDAVRYVEHLPNPPPDDRRLPDLCFALYERMVIFDHINKTITVVAHAPGVRSQGSGGRDQGSGVGEDELKREYQEACGRVDQLIERLGEAAPGLPLSDIAPSGGTRRGYESNFLPDEFERAVEKCKEYIKAGDIFQVVLSQRLATQTTARPFDIYRTLRVVNPSPFMFYLKCGGVVSGGVVSGQSGVSHHSPLTTHHSPDGPLTAHHSPLTICLVGSSPEIMCRVEGDRVTIRPLAGTRPRGKTEDDDTRLAAELLADPKERAEHIMLVDLGRNDVGRVARFGTVQLSDVMSVERYSHVMHLSSNVSGRLQAGKTAFDALRACLPAGTLSGAPKVRAMQIIDELEPCRRGPYGGTVGYVDFAGNMDTCITLRTLVLMGQTAYIQAGAGIVADSVPEKEREETLNKAMGLLRALEIAEIQL